MGRRYGMFQPTHPHGVRRPAVWREVCRVVFQPTHPHGVRPGDEGVALQAGLCFNPRTRTGCDNHGVVKTPRFVRFQPTHPHGVRREGWETDLPDNVSTHAPARGATGTRGTRNPEPGVSTHAPARGATLSLCSSTHVPSSFNPRTRTGCDLAICMSLSAGGSFNPRTRTGCD